MEISPLKYLRNNEMRSYKMKKMLLLLPLILMISIPSYAFDDYRWENPSTFIQTEETFYPPETSTPLPKQDSSPEKSLYEIEKEKKTLDVLKETPTPLRTPDTIIRVLMLPYTDSNNVLHSYYYTFVKVEDGSWVLGDYLNSVANKPKKLILHHIDAPVPSRETIEQQQHGKKEHTAKPQASPMPIETTSQPEQNSSEYEEAK
jgi:hypothetical protein